MCVGCVLSGRAPEPRMQCQGRPASGDHTAVYEQDALLDRKLYIKLDIPHALH